MADEIEAIGDVGGARSHGGGQSHSVESGSFQVASLSAGHHGQQGASHVRDSYAPDPDRGESNRRSAPKMSWVEAHKSHGTRKSRGTHPSRKNRRPQRGQSTRKGRRATRAQRAARARAGRGTGAPRQKPPAETTAYLRSKLAGGVNPNRITNLNGPFAKDLSAMLSDLQTKHGFNSRITSGWRPQAGSNHAKGMAADITEAGRHAISNAQLRMIRGVAAQHGLKILDERHGGVNKHYTGPHLHISRTGR